jgi:hypothetical protein
MQALLNFAFDLDTAAGRAEFQRMFQHLVTETDERQGMPLAPDLPAEAETQAETALTGRQAAAAKARAAKAAKAAGALIENGEDLSGPPLNGGADAEAEDIGLVDPGMSPAEAKEAALAVVREVYAAGEVGQVKALQKAWGIAKFYDIPDAKGHEFYQQVMKLAHETGLRK